MLALSELASRGQIVAIVVDPPFGSYTLAAEALSARYSCTITRQQVYAWARRRSHNHFPVLRTVRGRDGVSRDLLDLAEVITWYATYKPRTNTHPLRDDADAVSRGSCRECGVDAGTWCIDEWGRRREELHAIRR